ncbi:AMP-binding protein [Streptomyces sp. NPDC092296]|uniref:AMP-binding protein n=1 Tax=Streptomyces sp. NPDC092296 TaxID=3366012 RepID=UPI0038239259
MTTTVDPIASVEPADSGEPADRRAPADGRAPAVLDGGPLPELPVATLGAALLRAAALPDAGLIHFVRPDGGDVSMTYAELLDDARSILTGLRVGGARPGDKVLLQIRSEREALGTFWAALLGGLIPIPVAPGTVEDRAAAAERLELVWEGYGRPWVVVGSDGPAAIPAMDAVGSWLGRVGWLRANAPADEFHQARPEDLAVLLLTSGSSGTPKAVALTHRNIIARSTATAAVRGLDRTTRSFNWMPLDHIGGLVMFHARDVLLGCTQVHAGFQWILDDPTRWFDRISRYRADTTWAPNFAFGLVNDRAEQLSGRDWDLSRLRYIMNGGESVKARVIRRFLDLLAPYGLPRDSMHPGWGMSETSAGVVDCVFDPDAPEGRFVEVGRPHPGVTLRVVDEHDRPLPTGTVGRLQVRGAPITSGYYENPAKNAEAFTEDGWFRSGDLAVIEDGTLTVTGRVDDLILLNGTECHGHEIEAAAEELDFVEPSYTVASPVTVGPDGGEQLAVFYHPRGDLPPGEAARRIQERVAARCGLEVGQVLTIAKEDVPKTGIGKLRRAQLRQQFEARTAPGGVG